VRIGRQPLAGGPSGAPAGVLGQLAVFAVIGVLSTLAYLGLFILLRGIGSAQMANLGALLATAVVNTAANRRLTFGVRGREGAGRAQLQGPLVFALGLALTSGSLTLLHAATSLPTRAAEVGVLVAASAAATVLRFVLLRSWTVRTDRAVAGTTPPPWPGDDGDTGSWSAGSTPKPAELAAPRLAA
jgi:putative flippase GtrA